MSTKKRKDDHLDICLSQNVAMKTETGLSDVILTHNALTNVRVSDIDVSCSFVGKTLRFPLIIEAMTGGTPRGGELNRLFARVAQQKGIALGVGSQRAMIEHPHLAETYAVRDVAPDILLFGNIGLLQLAHYGADVVNDAVKQIEADALCIHLNPLQELIQPEGDRDFSLVEKGLEETKKLHVPFLFKETGAGISGQTAGYLSTYNPAAIDVAASGGTSWSVVESFRSAEPLEESFREWGIPLVSSLVQCVANSTVPIIASGGIRSGVDGAKCIVLGATLFGAATPFLHAAVKGENALVNTVEKWEQQFIRVMALTGASSLEELRHVPFCIIGRTKDTLTSLGLPVARW